MVHVKNMSRKKRKLPLASLLLINDLFTKYYKNIKNAKERGKKIAYCTFGVPKQYLMAMDIVPVFPQFHAGFQSARKKAVPLLKAVEDTYGLPLDICGEVKASIGMLLYGDTMSFELPKPDMIVSSTNVCLQASKGFQLIESRLGLPHYIIDTPFVFDEQCRDNVFEFAKSQIYEMIQQIENTTSNRFDRSEFQKIIHEDLLSMKIFDELMKLQKRTPSPLNGMDLYIAMMGWNTFDPRDGGLLNMMINLYNNTYKMCEQNSSNSNEATEIRLLWDLLPVYHQKDYFDNIFDNYNANVVASTYFYASSWYNQDQELTYEYPITIEKAQTHSKKTMGSNLEQHIIHYLENTNKMHMSFKKKRITDLINDFKIDAVIMHMDRTCRTISLGQYEIRKFLEKELNIPVFLFDGDSMDDRFFSESQLTTRLEAFFESMLFQSTGRLS